jgi:hypothetical protein
MEKKIIQLFTIIFCIILSACDLPTSGTANKTLGGGTEQLPDGDDGTNGGDFTITGTNPVFFETHAKKYVKPQGYTLWQKRGALNIKTASTGLTVKLAKISGNSNGGYGVFFCEGNSRMLTVLLRLDAAYCIGEVIGTTYHEIVPWTYALFNAPGAENTVNISWDSSSSPLDYKVSINGSEVHHFTDSIAPVTGSGFGYVVVLTGEENFPETPVKISFEKL